MDPLTFPDWYCCLRSQEQGSFSILAAWFTLTLGSDYPLTLWDAYWDASGDVDGSARDAFVACYGLAVVTTGDGDFIRYTDLLFWGYVANFFIYSPTICAEGCQWAVPYP